MRRTVARRLGWIAMLGLAIAGREALPTMVSV